MRKYGLSNFTIEVIEETNNPEERETFWIEQKVVLSMDITLQLVAMVKDTWIMI